MQMISFESENFYPVVVCLPAPTIEPSWKSSREWTKPTSTRKNMAKPSGRPGKMDLISTNVRQIHYSPVPHGLWELGQIDGRWHTGRPMRGSKRWRNPQIPASQTRKRRIPKCQNQVRRPRGRRPPLRHRQTSRWRKRRC